MKFTIELVLSTLLVISVIVNVVLIEALKKRAATEKALKLINAASTDLIKFYDEQRASTKQLLKIYNDELTNSTSMIQKACKVFDIFRFSPIMYHPYTAQINTNLKILDDVKKYESETKEKES